MHIAYLTDNINKVARQSKEAKDRRRIGAPGRVESWKKSGVKPSKFNLQIHILSPGIRD